MSNLILLTVAGIVILGIALGIDAKIYLLVALYMLLFGIFLNAPPALLLTYIVIFGALIYIQYRESVTPSKPKKNMWEGLMSFVQNNTETTQPVPQLGQYLPSDALGRTLKSLGESLENIPMSFQTSMSYASSRTSSSD